MEADEYITCTVELVEVDVHLCWSCRDAMQGLSNTFSRAAQLICTQCLTLCVPVP